MRSLRGVSKIVRCGGLLFLAVACARGISSRPTPEAVSPLPPAPTSAPSPLAAGQEASPTPAASGLAIRSFRAAPEAIMPGEVFTLTWETEGAVQAWLYPFSGGRLLSGIPVSPTGARVLTAPSDLRRPLVYMLSASDASGASVAQLLPLPLRQCPEPWFFPQAPAECPAGPPLVSFAAYQPFERGHMIWIQARDEIFVLFADEPTPRWRVFPDLFEEGMLELDPMRTPPAGRLQPIRGFGLVWRSDPEVQARLGWALQPERGFTTRIQATARERDNVLFIQAPDGRIWRLEMGNSTWSYVPSPSR